MNDDKILKVDQKDIELASQGCTRMISRKNNL